MTIRFKLNANMILVAVGILVIAGFSLSGMKFVQDKLHILTEKSTPYQLKTIALQRTMQEHISNLLKASSVASEAEFNQNKEEIAKSLEDVRKMSQELASLKGESDGGSKLQEMEKITGDIVAVVSERLKAEAAGKVASQVIDQKLGRVNAGFEKLSSKMKVSQKKGVGELSSSNDSVKRASVKNTLTQGMLNALNDLKLALVEVSASDQKASFDAAATHISSSLQATNKNLFMRSEKNSPVGKAISAMIADITKTTSPGGALYEAKTAVIVKGDVSAKAKVAQEADAVSQKITATIAAMNDYNAKNSEKNKEDASKFDKSLESSVMTSEYLSTASDLISDCGDIRAAIKEMFIVRTEPELMALKNKASSLFSKTSTMLTSKMKSVEGSSIIGAGLNDVRTQLLNTGGVVETLQKIIRVNKQLADHNLKLKAIVIEQKKAGEAGMTAARTDQEKAVKEVNRVFKSSIIGVSVIGLLVLVLSIAFSIFLGSSITRPIKELSHLAEQFGHGDFSGHLDDRRKDEFGVVAAHFNTASSRLGDIVSDLTRAISQLVDSSDKLSATSSRLQDGAQEQASQASQSATALEEVSRSIVGVAQNAGQAAQVTRDSSSVAATGKATVMEVVNGMDQIAHSVGETSDKVQKLGESSEKIGSIVDVIKEIADQTNLLALNAAIEAARAGESGMGFAVVASEVRNLAKRTTDATKEIEDMIKDIQLDTAGSISTMNSGKRLVDDGVVLARRAQESLDSIVSASDGGAALVEQIATSAEEQASVIQEVSVGVERMADLTKTADQDSQHISSEAQELARIASDLGQKAAWFKFSKR